VDRRKNQGGEGGDLMEKVRKLLRSWLVEEEQPHETAPDTKEKETALNDNIPRPSQ
jgi:hypothetical protein